MTTINRYMYPSLLKVDHIRVFPSLIINQYMYRSFICFAYSVLFVVCMWFMVFGVLVTLALRDVYQRTLLTLPCYDFTIGVPESATRMSLISLRMFITLFNFS